MKTIWRYELKLIGNQIIKMPANSIILSVHVKDNLPHIWAIVDPTESKEDRFFEFFPTGKNLYETLGDLKYLGTVLLNNDSLVFHLFERIVFKSNEQ